MKYLFFLSISLLLSAVKPAPKTFYYFGESRAMHREAIAGKQVILYSGVKKIICEESQIDSLTGKWAAKVHMNCQNQGGCTSDLNIYETQAAADSQYNNTLKDYHDTTHYVLHKDDF